MLKRILPAVLALAFIPTAKAGNMSDLTPGQVCLAISTVVDNQVVPELNRVAMVSILDRSVASESGFLFIPGDCRAVMSFTLAANSKIFPGKYAYIYQMKLKLVGVQTESILDNSGTAYGKSMKLEDVIIWQIQGMAADTSYESLKVWTGKLAAQYFEQFVREWNSQH